MSARAEDQQAPPSVTPGLTRGPDEGATRSVAAEPSGTSTPWIAGSEASLRPAMTKRNEAEP